VLLMGMGGSSLFPEVLARTYGSRPGRPRLHVLDTTDPAAIARLGEQCPPERTLHLAASKSGSTIETRCHLEWAWWRAGGDGPFAVITDPRSDLGALARDRNFYEVFENRPDIGGRYSALSLFGIVPALLCGLDVDALLAGAATALADCGPSTDPAANPALALAAAMAAGVANGRDKLTVVLPQEAATFGLWLEQLVAESLGKDGTGVVPVVNERLGPPGAYGEDRLVVVDGSPQLADARDRFGDPQPHLVLDGPSGDRLDSLGRAVVVWEVAVALTGAALHVQPFDQPDVAAAKEATARVLDGDAPEPDQSDLDDLLSQLRPGDHLAIQAFVDPGSSVVDALEDVRTALRDRHSVAVTLGIGPRFLHSTGQLHKGGPAGIVCVQVLGDDSGELDIPGRSFGFGHLKAAQATGDLLALRERGIRAGRVPLADLLAIAAGPR
jgi:transaldolase / glucose-6-phosphate isomerase